MPMDESELKGSVLANTRGGGDSLTRGTLAKAPELHDYLKEHGALVYSPLTGKLLGIIPWKRRVAAGLPHNKP